MKFKYRPAIQVPIITQGLVYFLSQSGMNRKYVKSLAFEVGGKEYEKAIYQAMTTNDSLKKVSIERYCSEPTLYRYIKKYYEKFSVDEFMKK